ncbi:hypothetical protein LZ198_03275 [Myxococcus sp. K15C18031901]|uniref:hypothetical protein n=1 Tax=Myxococcus dinghuensis TaxID=2906761 RepID=UPI0020A7BA11|nr:hypothetical protein [Myxococcus dinghuensis]MCP3097893.1 hypothetical protein [Myxococcus dinghuensis]
MAVRIDLDDAGRKKWLRSRLEGQTQSVAGLIDALRQRPLHEMVSAHYPFELYGAVPEAEAAQRRVLFEALLDLAVQLGGRGELAEFALEGQVRCFLWEKKKRALAARPSDPRVKTDFLLFQRRLQEAGRKYKPAKTAALRCSCGAPVTPEATTCADCERDFTAPIAIERRPRDLARLRPLRARLMELKIPLPEEDVFEANVFHPRHAFDALTYDALMPKAGLVALEPDELRRRVELLSEVQTWPKRYAFPRRAKPQSGERFDHWCRYGLEDAEPAARKVLERLAREQGHWFQDLLAVDSESPGWLAAGEVSGSSLPCYFSPADVGPALDCIRRFAGARVALVDEYLTTLQRIAPDLLTAKERKHCEGYVDARAIKHGTGFGDFLGRRAAKAKSPVQGLSSVLGEAGDPDVDDFSRSTLKSLSRAAVEWLVDARPPEVADVEAGGLVRQFNALRRAKAFPEVILQRAEEARRQPAPFGIAGAPCWDVQPGRLSAEDLEARVACPECNRRLTPRTVFHLPTLEEGMQARTLRLYECGSCDGPALLARAVTPVRATKTPVRAFLEYPTASSLAAPLPSGFVPWRYSHFLERQEEGVRPALRVAGLPLSPEVHDPRTDMALRCRHPFVRIRLHALNLGVQSGVGGTFVVGQLCMTPGCKKPDARTQNDD